MKSVGRTAAELKAGGYELVELKAAGFSAVELKDAAFSAADMKAIGFTCKDLGTSFVGAGFSVSDLVDAGFPEVEALNADQDAIEQARRSVMEGAVLRKYTRAKLQAHTNHVPVQKRCWVQGLLLHWNSLFSSPHLIDRAQLGRPIFGFAMFQSSAVDALFHASQFENEFLSHSVSGPSQLLNGSGIHFDSSNCFSVFFVINPNPGPGQGRIVTIENCQLDLVASSRSEAESWVRGIQAIVGKL
jgi:hypothetical protein